MEDEISIENVCCTCLSTERNLRQLCRVEDGVNNLYSLLSYNPEAYETIFVQDMTQLFICWECEALLKRFSKFREQVYIAQLKLIDIADGKISYANIKSLSKLLIFRQNMPDPMGIEVGEGENFVDCGSPADVKYDIQYIKYESENEEVPLVQSKDLKPERDTVKSNIKSNNKEIIKEVKKDICTDDDESDYNFDDNVTSDEDLDDDPDFEMPKTKIEPAVAAIPTAKYVVKSRVKRNATNKNYGIVNIPIWNVNKKTNDNISKKKDDTEDILNYEWNSVETQKNYEKLLSKNSLNVNECNIDIIKMNDAEMLENIKTIKSKPKYVNALNKCESCIEIFEDCYTLEKHISELHTKKPNKAMCNVCKVYLESGFLNEHMKEHYIKYVCRICKESFQYKGGCTKNVALHLRNKHLMKDTYIDEQTKMLKQQEILLIPSKDNTEPNFGKKLTLLVDNPKGPGFACLQCKKYFKTKNIRNKHIQKNHGDGHQCPTCGKKFLFSNTLRRHEMTHKPHKYQKCPICSNMVRVALAKIHALTHSNSQQYACVTCNKKFKTKMNYENHLKYARSHTDRRAFEYKCTVCGKDYRSPGELRDHYNYRHAGKTHHKCPICDKALATKKSVGQHMERAHSAPRVKLRDKICPTCGKGFFEAKSLKEHEMVHTGEKPLSCDLCARTFRQKAGLYTHKRRVHKMALKKPVQHTEDYIVMNSEINKNT